MLYVIQIRINLFNNQSIAKSIENYCNTNKIAVAVGGKLPTVVTDIIVALKSYLVYFAHYITCILIKMIL